MKTALLFICLFLVADVWSQERHWTSPDHLVVQYAGSIGYVSGGVGYDLFRNKVRASGHFGHVPKALGGPLNIFAGKFIFVPARFDVSKRLVVNPFDFGLMISYHLGEDFQSRWPDQQYPRNYYWWQTSFRFHLNIESSLTLRIRDYTTFKAVTAYIELNSNELYLVSYIQNRHALSVADILKIGAGARFHF